MSVFLSNSGGLYLTLFDLMYDYGTDCALFWLCDGDFHSVTGLQVLFALPYALTQAHTWLGVFLLNHISPICTMKSNTANQNVNAGLLFVSMMPGSRDRVSFIWIGTAYMHNHDNLCFILQVTITNVLVCKQEPLLALEE